jgi:hypothetical protein
MAVFLMRPDDDSLATSRGIESIDQNIVLLLVKAPVATVAETLQQLKHWATWIPNAMGRRVDTSGSAWVFRFQGHPWTIVYTLNVRTREMWLEEPDAAALSTALQVPVISYAGSDTGGWLQYYFYAKGILLERLRSDQTDAGEEIEFESTWRAVTHPIPRSYPFTLDFIRTQDAYIPAFVINNIAFEAGKSITVAIDNTRPEEIERIDYLTHP